MTTPRTRGFTLIEAVLYVALASVVLYLASSLYAAVIMMHAKNRSLTDVTIASEVALTSITQTIRDARRVTAPEVGENSDEISLEMRDGAPYPTVGIALLNGAIVMQDGSQAQVPLTPSDIVVSDLLFTNMSAQEPYSIRVSFTATSNAGERAEYGYTDTFYATATIR